MSNNSKALRAGLWYTVSSITLKAISIFTAPIFTRLLTPEDYGKFNVFFSWQTIFACIFGLCLSYSIGRAKIDYEEDFDGFIASIQTLSVFVGILLFSFALPFLGSIASFMELDKGLLISLIVMLIVSPSIDFMQSKFRFEYRYKENIIIAIINTIGVIVLSICFILLSELEERYVGRIMGTVVPTFLLGLFAIIYLYIKGKRIIQTEYWKYALRLSLPMIPHGLAMVVLAQIDRIMLIKLDSFEAAGLYSFGYSYALMISIFTNTIMNAWQPWLYDKVHEKKYDEIVSSNKQINILAFSISIALITIGPEVIMILGSDSFWTAKWMVAPVIASCFFQFLYGYFSLMELYSKRTELIALGSVVAAVLKIVLNLFFIPKFGFVGAAYSTMLAYAALLSYHWLVFRHIFKHKIFAEKQILFLVLLSIMCTIVLEMSYNTYLIRYALLIIILTPIIIIYRGLIKELFRKYFLRNNAQYGI